MTRHTASAFGIAPSNGLAQIQRVSGCVGQALGSNAGSLLLDAAGVALTVSPIGAEAKVVGAIALGTASTVVERSKPTLHPQKEC
jgi:hypothetical protein